MVEGVFGLLKRDSLTITWISRLQYRSAKVFASQSRLSATLKGEPTTYPRFHTYAWGIQIVFKIQDRIFLLLRLFNVDDRDSFGMPTTTMPTGFTPAERIVKVGSSPPLI